MEYIKIIIYASLPMAIIFFIINNIIPAKNYAKRTLILSIILIGFLLLFGGAMLFDYYIYGNKPFTHYQYYLAAGAMILINLGFVIYNIIQTFRYHHRLGGSNKSYQKDISQYLYIVYRYGGMYYLRKETRNGDDLYTGDCIPFGKGSFFYDEAFNKYASNTKIEISDYSYIGSATANQKKKMVFYCFLVDLASEDNLESYEKISPYEIVNINMLDLHKTLIMRILIGEQFNIEL